MSVCCSLSVSSLSVFFMNAVYQKLDGILWKYPGMLDSSVKIIPFACVNRLTNDIFSVRLNIRQLHCHSSQKALNHPCKIGDLLTYP